MTLPIEVIENILLNCDGKTLLTAQRVNAAWKNVVDYLSRKTKIWQWCCKEEIPKKELLDYLEKYADSDPDKWVNIYSNWVSWKDIGANIRCETILCPVEVQRISCIAVLGQYIAIGSDSGRVKIYTENWKLIHAARHLAIKVNQINFLHEQDGNEVNIVNLAVAIAYDKTLFIDNCVNLGEDELMIQDIKALSVHRNYICYEQLGGRVTISRLNNFNGIKQLEEIWFDRIYSPSNISCMNIWNGICTLLINKEVKIMNYKRADLIPVSKLEIKAKLQFTIPNQWVNVNYVFQILRDDIVISLWKQSGFDRDEFIEFFILRDKEQYSKKLFNTWDVLGAFITCIFVYGNTLILGVDIGNVYFYHISSWKHFDIRDYQRKIILGKHPIIGIAVKEVKNERIFFISSSFSVHKIVGFTTEYLTY